MIKRLESLGAPAYMFIKKQKQEFRKQERPLGKGFPFCLSWPQFLQLQTVPWFLSSSCKPPPGFDSTWLKQLDWHWIMCSRFLIHLWDHNTVPSQTWIDHTSVIIKLCSRQSKLSKPYLIENSLWKWSFLASLLTAFCLRGRENHIRHKLLLQSPGLELNVFSA